MFRCSAVLRTRSSALVALARDAARTKDDARKMQRVTDEILRDFAAVPKSELNQLLTIIASARGLDGAGPRGDDKETFWDTVLPLARAQFDTPLERAYLCSILAKLKRPQMVPSLVQEVIRAPETTLFELGILADAWTKLDLDSSVKDAIATAVENKIDQQCDNACVAGLLTAFKDHPTLRPALEEKTVALLADNAVWEARNICSVCNSMRLHPTSPVFAAAAGVIRRQPHDFDAKATAILLNAFSSIDDSALARKIAGILLANDSIEWRFSRDISQSLNALAKMEYGDSIAVEHLCDAFLRIKWTARDIANVLDALSRLGVENEEIIQKAREFVPGNISHFRDSRDVAATFVAFGRFKVRDVPLFVTLSHQVERNFDAFSLPQLADIVTSFARLDIRDVHFLQRVAEYVCKKKVCSTDAVTFLSAFGRLQIAHPDMLDHLGSSLEFPLSASDAKEVVVAFSLAPRHHPCVEAAADQFPAHDAHVFEVYRALARLRIRHEGVRQKTRALVEESEGNYVGDVRFLNFAYAEVQLEGKMTASWPRRNSELTLDKGGRLRAATSSLATIAFGAADEVGPLSWFKAAIEDKGGLHQRIDRIDLCLWSHLALWNAIASKWAWSLPTNTLLTLELLLMDVPLPKEDGWKLDKTALSVYKELAKLDLKCDTNVFLGGGLRTDMVVRA